MSTTAGRFAIGLAGAALVVLGAAAPALAAGGSPVARSENVCQVVDAHLTICVDAIEVAKETLTGNGGVVYIDNATGSQSDYVDGLLVETDRIRFQSQSVYHDANAPWQEAHAAFHQVTTYAGGAGCTIDQRYHFAGGQIQFDTVTNTCPQ